MLDRLLDLLRPRQPREPDTQLSDLKREHARVMGRVVQSLPADDTLRREFRKAEQAMREPR